ncbi:MAG: helix-turn-helix transcriptional regulator [Devosia sp.]|nr:helix-turn-helix transcriptional regulator [Devosia sp.]
MTARVFLAWNLRKLRVEAGISQEKLAADASVDRAYLGGLERQRENPTIDLLQRIADALGVEFSDLFARPSPDEEPPAPLRAGRPGRSK